MIRYAWIYLITQKWKHSVNNLRRRSWWWLQITWMFWRTFLLTVQQLWFGCCILPLTVNTFTVFFVIVLSILISDCTFCFSCALLTMKFSPIQDRWAYWCNFCIALVSGKFTVFIERCVMCIVAYNVFIDIIIALASIWRGFFDSVIYCIVVMWCCCCMLCWLAKRNLWCSLFGLKLTVFFIKRFCVIVRNAAIIDLGIVIYYLTVFTIITIIMIVFLILICVIKTFNLHLFVLIEVLFSIHVMSLTVAL